MTATAMEKGSGTRADPWRLTTPSGQSQIEVYRDEEADPPALVVFASKTEVRYLYGLSTDLHAMLKSPTATGCHWATRTRRSPSRRALSRHGPGRPENPVGGWYGLKKGLRGRFANYVPPVLEAIGLAEVEHDARNNRMRAI